MPGQTKCQPSAAVGERWIPYLFWLYKQGNCWCSHDHHRKASTEIEADRWRILMKYSFCVRHGDVGIIDMWRQMIEHNWAFGNQSCVSIAHVWALTLLFKSRFNEQYPLITNVNTRVALNVLLYQQHYQTYRLKRHKVSPLCQGFCSATSASSAGYMIHTKKGMPAAGNTWKHWKNMYISF